MNRYDSKNQENQDYQTFQKPEYIWPTGPDFFSGTNVEAIVRNIEKEKIERGLSEMVNLPALALKPEQ